MRYAITKGKGTKPLTYFAWNDLPIKKNATIFDRLENPDKVFSSRMFAFDKNCYTIFGTGEDALAYIQMIKMLIEENRQRYEDCVRGSADKLLKIADKLIVVEIHYNTK